MEVKLHASYISKTFQRFDDWKNFFQNRLKQLRTRCTSMVPRALRRAGGRICTGKVCPGSVYGMGT